MLLHQIRDSIENGYPKDTENYIQQALKEGYPIKRILEESMVPAMQKIGDLYRSADTFIPQILASARSMRKGLDALSPYLEKETDPSLAPIATVIVGTVAGDLHDIGKNLVAIMFRCAGFQIIDLGVDVSSKVFLKTIKEHPEVSLVCISTLLTTSMPQMKQLVKSIRHAFPGRPLKIMVGGAPVTQEFADEIGADGYTENAVDAARLARTFFTS
ncbi:methionine synthase [Blautia sp. An249]|uniref:cobalamin B12-binding domain-containing protein n=1 Tax=Blautia sp. An249 TaxID=1965603 RepID=UPI000B3A7930|nr:corrinoid protein [Blautia sp. An249]OUO79334.1 methionine synthase [Blautia sp. An249]